MNPVLLVIADIIAEETAQVLFIQRDHVIENLLAATSDPSFGRSVLPRHHDRVVVCLNGAELEHLFADGHKEPSTLKTGEVTFRAGSTHIGRNIGRSDVWVIAIEPK